MSNSNNGFDPTLKKAIAIALTVIFVFCTGYVIGMTGNIHVSNESAPVVEPSAVEVDATADQTAQAPTDDPLLTEPITEAPTELSTDALPTEAPTTVPATPTTSSNSGTVTTTKAPALTTAPTTTKPVQKTPSTKAEILALFTKSANKIKTSAKKVTRNYEDLQHNEDKLEVPAILKGIGTGLINTFLKKDETPVDYATKEDIIKEYPVRGQNYVTAAKESDLKSATCTDDGKYYNVTLTFIDATDPTNTGAATSFNIIKADEVYAAASVVKSFSATYYDAKIVCKIDKATGNMVSATYTLPIVMKVKALGVDAQVGMTFIDDYSITY